MGPSLYYVSKGTGWVGSENWQLLLIFSTIFISSTTIYADVGGSKKSPKICWRNIGIVSIVAVAIGIITEQENSQ